MTPQQIQTAAPPIAAGLFAFALVLFLLSLRYFRRSRTDFYWRRRRSAGQRGWRLFLWSIIMTLLSGVLCMAAGIAGIAVSRSLTPTAVIVIATSPPTNTSAVTRAASITPSSTATQTATQITATAVSTSTATLSTAQSSAQITKTSPAQRTSTRSASSTRAASMTPSSAPVPLASSTLQSSVTPGPDANLTITALDTQISATFGPVTPGNDFSAGFPRIYYFVTFSGMQSGVLWKRQLLHDGKVIDDTAYLWGLAQEGTGYFFFGQEGGFKPGYYEIRLFIGDTEKPAASAGFQVK